MNRHKAQYLTSQAFTIVSRALHKGYNQGEVEAAKQLLEEALPILEMAIEADPTYAHALNERAFVLSRLQRLDEAAASARKAISLAPHVPKFRTALIGIGLNQIRFRKSREERRRFAETYRSVIDDLIKTFPHYPSGFMVLAELQAMTGAGQSLWEDSLSKAANAFFKMRRMSSGEPATEAAVAQALEVNIINCLDLASEWDRLRE